MTSIWGPMGWMTLHSISAAYPDNPTQEDRSILYEFMESFANTISCELCRNHFRPLFLSYKTNVPTWADSKQEVFMMICRLHNNVNTRLDKPIPKTVEECIKSLVNATAYTCQKDFRKNYIDYLSNEFRGQKGIPLRNFIERMRKINEEYWNSREIAYTELKFEEEDIVSFRNQPVVTRLVFPKFGFRNFVFRPRL
jgi:hypothetical protein